jgi:hypothetical protein
VTIDPRLDGRVTVVIHELLHVYLSERLSIEKVASERVVEAMINGLEAELYNYVSAPSRTHLLESWNKAIGRKLSP